MKIILDNGHGCNTAGKQSPDGTLKEYAYAREIVNDIYEQLTGQGYDVSILVPEELDIPLQERCERANAICDELGKDNVLLVSVHVNAAGADGRWHDAHGWSAYTTHGETPSDVLAFFLLRAAEESLGTHQVRYYSPKKLQGDFEANFYILKHSKCTAVLTENLFQDNKDDVTFLLNNKDTITDIHVKGITEYIYQSTKELRNISSKENAKHRI